MCTTTCCLFHSLSYFFLCIDVCIQPRSCQLETFLQLLYSPTAKQFQSSKATLLKVRQVIASSTCFFIIQLLIDTIKAEAQLLHTGTVVLVKILKYFHPVGETVNSKPFECSFTPLAAVTALLAALLAHLYHPNFLMTQQDKC